MQNDRAMQNDSVGIFRDMPVRKAVLTLAIPTVIGQIISVIYNMADTLFIGQINEPEQVAAITVAMSMSIFMTALANLFGIGGASEISHRLGMGDRKAANACSAFCLRSAAAVAFLFGIGLYLARRWLLPLLGASGAVYDYACSYLFWTVTVGAVPTVLNETLAHLVRAEGYAKHAAFGVAFGGILNILLDPVFIFGLHMQIVGAAVATMLSNAVSMTYFIIILAIKRRDICTAIFSREKLPKGLASSVLLNGLPSFLSSFLASFSSSMLSRLTASYSSEAIAGAGIAKKIDLIVYAVAQGMTQGVLPLIGFNYACKNRKRMTRAITTTIGYAMSIACVMLVILFFFAEPITRCFIEDATTLAYGKEFLKVICLICPATTINFMCITVFQACEQRAKPVVLTFMRKGLVDVPLMFIFEHFFGFLGIAWAITVSEWVALAVALSMFIPYMRVLRDNGSVDMAESEPAK